MIRRSDKMKKLSYEEVYKYIEKEGFLLLSPDYKNSITPLEIKCPRRTYLSYNTRQF